MAESLYIHIPYCISKCKYCDFFSIPCSLQKVPDEYIQSLCNELTFRFKKNNVRELETVYIGGGTPSLLSKEQLEKIIDCIKKYTVFTKDYEFTIEVNPDDINIEYIKWLSQTDVNRISCGIQSMNEKSLNYVSRRSDSGINKEALKILKEYWKKIISVDLICGLPEETESSFINTLNQIIEYKPHHISMYSLTIEEETPLGKMYSNGELNYDFDKADSLWLKGYEFLLNNDYEHYEVSNFCRKGYECRHNLKYWNHRNYIGAGSGATGTVYNNDGSGFRWTNIKNLNTYINYWINGDGKNIPQEEEIITIENSRFEFFMMGLRKLSGINKNEYVRIFKEEIPENILKVMDDWHKKGLFIINKTEKNIYYSMGNKGILFLNKFLEEII